MSRTLQNSIRELCMYLYNEEEENYVECSKENEDLDPKSNIFYHVDKVDKWLTRTRTK